LNCAWESPLSACLKSSMSACEESLPRKRPVVDEVLQALMTSEAMAANVNVRIKRLMGIPPVKPLNSMFSSIHPYKQESEIT